MKALLVDDQPLFLEGLANLLNSRGIEVVGRARDGLEALEMAKGFRPDVILMDVEMPRCGGLEATRLIRAALPEAKIVMLSVSANDKDVFEAMSCGASGYLLKDVEAGKLFKLLSRLA